MAYDSKQGRQADKSADRPVAQQGSQGGQVFDKPAPQGDNPADRHDSKGVIPPGLESKESDPVPAYAPDHEAVLRAAKHAGVAGALGKGEDELEEIGQKVAQARALVDQRNRTTDGARVKEIDAELESLGFVSPVATTEAQRRGVEPLGRRSPGQTKA